MSFEAKYPGWCDDCEDKIFIGDEITYTDDTGKVVHVDCVDAHQPERKADVCTKCWLTKPCDCEES